MATMIERDVVGQIVYLHPFDGFVLRQRRSDLLNLGRVFKNLRVAIHARARRRDARHGRFVRRRVTVQTLNLVIAGVNLVREVDRLCRLIALLIPQAAKV